MERPRVSLRLDPDEFDLLVRVAEADNRTITQQVAHYIRLRVWADARRLWPREFGGYGPAHADMRARREPEPEPET